MNRLASLASLALALVAVAPARADIIPDGVKPVDHELVIELARDFPDTHLVVFPTDVSAPWQRGEEREMGVAVITSATPRVTLGKFASEPRLFAVRGPLPEKPETIDRAWLTAHHAVTCDHVFVQLRYVDEDEGVARIRTVYRVTDVTDTAVRLEGVREERFGPDGAVRSRSVPPVGPAGGEPDRRGGWLPPLLRGDEPTGLAMLSAVDPARAPVLAAALAALALGLLAARRERASAGSARSSA